MNKKNKLALVSILAFSLVACGDSVSSGPSDQVLEPGEKPISRDQLDTLVDPVPDSGVESYRAQTITYRSYGSNMVARSAVVTRTDTWETLTVHEGDTFGRNLRVVAIEPSAIILQQGGEQELRLETNRDLTLEVIKHDIDVAVTAELGHRFTVNAPYLMQANQVVGLGAEAFSEHVDQLGHGALSITSVSKGGVIDRLGFEANDILIAINGQPADQGTGSLNHLARLLASGTERIVQVEMVRGPDHLTTTFVVKGASIPNVQR